MYSLTLILDGDGKQDDQHWSLHLSDPQVSANATATSTSTTIQTFTLSTSRLSITHDSASDPRDSPSYAASVHLSYVRSGDVARIEELAREVRLDRWRGWNCQDFVMELLGLLEEEGVVSVENVDYQKQKRRLVELLHCRNAQ
jgi:hypothetical protein